MSPPTAADIRAHRVSSGLSQTAYAALAHATRSACALWESGGGISGAAWAILRARVALLRGDRRGALEVLAE